MTSFQRKQIFGLFVGLLLCSALPRQAHSQTCPLSAGKSALRARLAAHALHEYTLMNGHRINADGRLWKFGSAESETELLRNPVTGAADASQLGRYAWRRVWEYWLTLEQHRPGTALGRKVIYVPHLVESPESAEPSAEIRLGALLLPDTGGDDSQRDALNQAAIRAAVNDSPWSATFISFLMHQAGMSETQFRYSASHWRYIQEAFEQPAGYAYRACDPKHTVPSQGDLLCYGRGATALQDFASWRTAVGEAGFSAASHCDLVTEVDTDAKKMEVVGGNVLQSVTRRKLKLNQENLLSESHYRGSARAGSDRECDADITCERSDLNQQYWGVLLQLLPLDGAVTETSEDGEDLTVYPGALPDPGD